MAVDYLAKDFLAKPFPFQQVSSFNATRYSTVPWGQAIVNESWQSPSTGAGNTGLMSIDIQLPQDYVAILRNFHLQAVDNAQINWGDAILGMAYQEPGGPYKNKVTDYPEDQYSWYELIPSSTKYVMDRLTATIGYLFYTLGTENTTTGFSDSWDPTQLPIWVPPTTDASFAQRSVIMYIENASASQPNAEFTLRASWDLYTLEQAYSAAVMSSPRVFT